MPPLEAGAWAVAPPPNGDGVGAEEPPKTELTLVAVPGAAEPPPNTDELVPNTPPPPPIGFAAVVVVDTPPNTDPGLLAAAAAVAAPKTDVLPPVATAPNEGVAVADPLPVAAPNVTGLFVPVDPNRFVGALVGCAAVAAAAPPKLKVELLLG